MIRLGIVGGRNYTDYESFKIHLCKTLKNWNLTIANVETVVSGGAKGADSLAER